MKKTFILLILFFAGLLLYFYFKFESGPGKEQTQSNSSSLIKSENIESSSKKLTRELLSGKWQSSDDPNSQIAFQDSVYIEYYEDKKLDEQKFSIADSCPDDSAEPKPDSDGKYISIDDMCYYIVSVDNISLEMSVSGRGNTLRYSKIK